MIRVVILAFATLAMGCAGGHARLSFDRAAYPVSLSPTVPDADGQILAPERFEVVGQLSVQTKAWAILYSAVPLQGKHDVSDDINTQITAQGGRGDRQPSDRLQAGQDQPRLGDQRPADLARLQRRDAHR